MLWGKQGIMALKSFSRMLELSFQGYSYCFAAPALLTSTTLFFNQHSFLL
jgi:hypothetical protein